MTEDERIREYLNVPNWKCNECGTTVFGRCRTCPYCRERLGKITEGPAYLNYHWEPETPKVDEYEDEA